MVLMIRWVQPLPEIEDIHKIASVPIHIDTGTFCAGTKVKPVLVPIRWHHNTEDMFRLRKARHRRSRIQGRRKEDVVSLPEAIFFPGVHMSIRIRDGDEVEVLVFVSPHGSGSTPYRERQRASVSTGQNHLENEPHKFIQQTTQRPALRSVRYECMGEV